MKIFTFLCPGATAAKGVFWEHEVHKSDIEGGPAEIRAEN